VADLPPPEERGRTVIADKVVERIAAMAAREIENVVDTRSGLSRLARGALPHAEAVVAGGTSRIKVEVAAQWPTPLSEIAGGVRDHVGERVHTLTGVEVVAVDVRVADMAYAGAEKRRVE
jgi:uncharacterized alkaline shock family protein YloU